MIGPGEKAFNATGGLGGPPLHIHLYQDEIFFVTAGEFLVEVGDDEFHLKEGDTVFAPRQVPHTFTHLTDKPTSSLLFFSLPVKWKIFSSSSMHLQGHPA